MGLDAELCQGPYESCGRERDENGAPRPPGAKLGKVAWALGVRGEVEALLLAPCPALGLSLVLHCCESVASLTPSLLDLEGASRLTQGSG